MRAIEASIESRSVIVEQPPLWYLGSVEEFMQHLLKWESGELPRPTKRDYEVIRLWEENNVT